MERRRSKVDVLESIENNESTISIEQLKNKNENNNFFIDSNKDNNNIKITKSRTINKLRKRKQPQFPTIPRRRKKQKKERNEAMIPHLPDDLHDWYEDAVASSEVVVERDCHAVVCAALDERLLDAGQHLLARRVARDRAEHGAVLRCGGVNIFYHFSFFFSFSFSFHLHSIERCIEWVMMFH